MTESNESSTTPAKAPPSDEVSARERLAQYLNEDTPERAEGEAGESQPTQAEAGAPKGKPKLLKEVAERLSVSDDDVYAIEVPLADGKTMPIGKMKDLAAKHDDFTVRELAFEERVAKQEADWTRAQTEMSELLAHIDPKAIKPELRDKVRQKIEGDQQRERALVLKTIPEWANETVRDADLGTMVEYLKDFGISESFLTVTMNHKLFRLVRDAALRKQRHERALAGVQQVRKPSTTGKGAPNGAPRKLDTKPQANARLTGRDRLQKALNS